MEFTFEDKIKYIEMVMGLKLLDWQIAVLKKYDQDDTPVYYVPARGCGKTVLRRAIILLRYLNDIIKKSNREITSWIVGNMEE